MSACPQCGVPVKPGKSFCSKCGAQVSPDPAEGSSTVAATKQGKSQLRLDPDSVNLLLEQFANQPDGAVFSFKDGKVLVQQGEIHVTMENLQMKDARVHLRHQRLGAVNLDLRDLTLGTQGLEANIDLSV